MQQENKWSTLAIALATPFIAAAVGGVATSSSLGSWYRRLRKPSWNPPSWVFGPVWNTLYLMMGLASWLVWRRREDKSGWFGLGGHDQKERVDGALRLYGIHLVFNALWSVIFFGMRRVDWAFAELLVLWSLILSTLTRFFQIDKRAGWLLVPYQLWVTFAAILNFTVWRMNRKR